MDGVWLEGSGAEARSGSWRVLVNDWNVGDLRFGEDYAMSAFAPEGGIGGARFEWDFPDAPDWWMPRAYPEAILGAKPWDGPETTDPLLPIPVEEAQVDLTFSLDWGAPPDQPRGGFNVAISLWLSDDPEAGREGIREEVMIWLGSGDFTPAGEVAGRGADALGDHAIWSNADHGDASGGVAFGWRYSAVVYDAPQRQGRIDLGEVLSDLEERELIAPDLFVMSVEIGAEVATGAGWLEVERFDVTPGGPVCGHPRRDDAPAPADPPADWLLDG